MFVRKEKPLPKPVFQVIENPAIEEPTADEGIYLGEKNCYWNPASLPNGHVVAIGERIQVKTYENNPQETNEQNIKETGYPKIKWELKYFHQDDRSVLRYKTHEPDFSEAKPPQNPQLNLEDEKFDIIVIEDSGRETEESFCNRKINGRKEYEYTLGHLSKPQEDTDNEQTIDNKRYAFPQVILLINKKLPNFQKDGFWQDVKKDYGDKTLAIIYDGVQSFC